METLEILGRKIRTAHDLLSVVKTMKSLAAVNIRHYEGAASAMDEYASVIAAGWQGLFYNQPHLQTTRKKSKSVCLILGSDQGMCGQFNEVIMEYALSWINGQDSQSQKPQNQASQEQSSQKVPLDSGTFHFWSAGERVLRGLGERVSSGVEEHFPLPSSTSAIADLMVDIVERLVLPGKSRQVGHFIIFYNHPARGGSYEPGMDQVLPLDYGKTGLHGTKKWPSRCLPMVASPGHLLFDALFQQHIFASIYKAFAQSLAGENAARLASMQAAEKNILEMEEKLQGSFRETRQNAITAELLDIICGFEAMGDAR